MDGGSLVRLIMLGVAGLLLLAVVFSTIFTVNQATAALITRFGKFRRVAHPGLQFKLPFVDQVAGRLSLRVQQLDVKVETKTFDDVFVKVMVSVQYFVQKDKVEQAFYRLEDPEQQITAYVYDVVRGRVPNIKLDDVFKAKDDIARAVMADLQESMEEFGYGITTALVNDIDPDEKVKAAMNEINAATRDRIAAEERGEARRIEAVKNAQAEAEAMKLHGQGVADQRAAIIKGHKESLEMMQAAGVSTDEAGQFVLMAQYMDTMRDMASSSETRTIFMPHSPGGLAELGQQIRDSMLLAEEARPAPQRTERATAETAG